MDPFICLCNIVQPYGHLVADLLALVYVTFCCVFVTFQYGVLGQGGT